MSLREIAEAAVVEAVAIVLHDHGPMNGQDEPSERWQDCPGGEIHGAVADKVACTPTMQALLDVVEAAGRAVEGVTYHTSWASSGKSQVTFDRAGTEGLDDLVLALARLPEEVR